MAKRRQVELSIRAGRQVGGREATAVAAGAGIGAGVMYLLDPGRGRRRRTMARDKAFHYAREGEDFSSKAARDLRNRWTGLFAGLRGWARGQPASQVLARRVRAAVDRTARRPDAISVEARDGVVTVAGPVLREEVDDVRVAVASVAGVDQVEDRLEVKEHPGDLPAVVRAESKGNGGPTMRVPEYWTPGQRVLAGAAGGALASCGLARRGRPGTLAGATGAVLLSRAASNLRLNRLTGVGAGRGAVELHKTIQVDAPVERVWELWDDYESFPRFMTNVREVRKGGEGRSHWQVEGPLGATLRWDAETTRRVPGELLAWRTLPGAALQHAGMVRFERADGGTRVEVTVSYNPVAGAGGHAVAILLGANPKRQLDEDLLRMKTLVEAGRAAHDAAKRG